MHQRRLSLSAKFDAHFTIPQRVEGWIDLGNAVKVRRLCPRLYIAVVFTTNKLFTGGIQSRDPIHRSQACYHQAILWHTEETTT